jgi:membrane protease subunit HflK
MLITKKRMFYETMEDVLPDLEVIITDGNTQSILPISPLVSGVEGGNN